MGIYTYGPDCRAQDFVPSFVHGRSFPRRYTAAEGGGIYTSTLGGSLGSSTIPHLRKDRLGLAAQPKGVTAYLNRHPVLRRSDLHSLIERYRHDWELAEGVGVTQVVEWLIDHTRLKQVSIRSEVRGTTRTRFTWGDVPPLAIAQSVFATGYFCHATAALLHDLIEFEPASFYINREQTSKPISNTPISQDAVDRAFTNKQRQSRDIYHWAKHRIVLISGKYSNQLGVEERSSDDIDNLRITGLERTLIDIVVRPDYCGGPQHVLAAFKKAKSRISVTTLLETLHSLAYRYPYHQAIGFYMQRAGYSSTELQKLHSLGMSLDFYLGYSTPKKYFDETWRVYYPKNVEQNALTTS